MDGAPEHGTAGDAATARTLGRLARLVTVLTATMIGGVALVVVLLAMRLTERPAPMLPETVTLPDDAKARAVTVGEGWFLVVTDRDEILVFDRTTGALRQRVTITPGQAQD